jgi:energy-coupling factor transporter ATP-binding protein EcfA2
MPQPTKTTPSHSKNVSSNSVTLSVVEGHYEFEKCLAFMEKKGKELFGAHFKIDPADYEIIFKLLAYVIGDEKNAIKHGISLKKGILLTGPIGCGKTSLMTLIRFFQPANKRFLMKSCREVSFEFIKDGYEVINKYSRNSFHNLDPKTYCFDDLGTENNLKYFGNDCNVMAEILLSRYDLFVTRKLLIHITTNLSASEIEVAYGNRIRSRMREMLNLISFDQSIKDKRL